MITLGYWETRGLAQPIRLLLKYVGVNFEDKRYPFGEGNTFDQIESIRKNWIPDKHTLGLEFPNLPYLIDGDVKITQSLAILRYLGRKHGLSANVERLLIQQDMVEQQFRDLNHTWFRSVLLSSDFEKSKESFVGSTLPKELKLLSEFLGSKVWFVEELTYVDFIAYETLDRLRLFSAETLNQFENLAQFLSRFENLPPIANYLDSEECIRWPVFGPISKWGYIK